MAIPKLRVTFLRQYEQDLVSIPQNTVMDLHEPLARRLNGDGYCEITPNASDPESVGPGGGLSISDTDELGEGQDNLYFTENRAREAVVNNSLGTPSVVLAPSISAVIAGLAVKRNDFAGTLIAISSGTGTIDCETVLGDGGTHANRPTYATANGDATIEIVGGEEGDAIDFIPRGSGVKTFPDLEVPTGCTNEVSQGQHLTAIFDGGVWRSTTPDYEDIARVVGAPIVITGDTAIGSTLTATFAAGWSGPLQWQRDDGGGWEDIAAETSSTFDTDDEASNDIRVLAGEATGMRFASNVITVDGPAPTLVSAVVEDADPNALVLTWSVALDSANPTGAGGVTLASDGGAITVTGVVNAGTTTTCALSRDVESGETITLDYASASSSSPFAAGAEEVADISDAAVTNNVAGSIEIGQTLAQPFATPGTSHESNSWTLSAGSTAVLYVINNTGQPTGVPGFTHRRTHQWSAFSNNYVSQYDAMNVAGGAGTITVNLAGSSTMTLLAVELTGAAASSYIATTINSQNNDEANPRTLASGAAIPADDMGLMVSFSGFGATNSFAGNDGWAVAAHHDAGTGLPSVGLVSSGAVLFKVSDGGVQTGSVNQSGSSSLQIISGYAKA